MIKQQIIHAVQQYLAAHPQAFPQIVWQYVALHWRQFI